MHLFFGTVGLSSGSVKFVGRMEEGGEGGRREEGGIGGIRICIYKVSI